MSRVVKVHFYCYCYCYTTWINCVNSGFMVYRKIEILFHRFTRSNKSGVVEEHLVENPKVRLDRIRLVFQLVFF